MDVGREGNVQASVCTPGERRRLGFDQKTRADTGESRDKNRERINCVETDECEWREDCTPVDLDPACRAEKDTPPQDRKRHHAKRLAEQVAHAPCTRKVKFR